LVGATLCLVGAAVAAVGRNTTAFVIALLLAIPAFGFQFLTCRNSTTRCTARSYPNPSTWRSTSSAIGYLLR
jgi:hypothetical protein